MMMSMVLEPLDVVERYLGLSSDPKAAYQEIAGWLKRQIKTERWDDLREALPRLIISGLDFTSAFSLYRMMQQVCAGFDSTIARPRSRFWGALQHISSIR